MSLPIIASPALYEQNPLAGALVIDPFRDISGRNIWPNAASYNPLGTQYSINTKFPLTTGSYYSVTALASSASNGRIRIATGGNTYLSNVTLSSSPQRISVSFVAVSGDGGWCYFVDSDSRGDILLTDIQVNMSEILAPYSAPAGLPQLLQNYGYGSGGHTYDGQNGSGSGADTADATWNQKWLSFPDGTDYITLPATPNVGDCTVMVVARIKAGLTEGYQTLYGRNNLRILLNNGTPALLQAHYSGNTMNPPATIATLQDTWVLYTARITSAGFGSMDVLPVGNIALSNMGHALDQTYTGRGHILGTSLSGTNWQGDIAFSAEWGKCLSDAEVIKKKKYITDLMFSRGIVIPGVSPLYGAMAIYDPYLQVAAGTTGQTLFDTSGNGNHMTLGSTAGSDSADPTWGAMNLNFPDGTDYAIASGKYTQTPRTIISVFSAPDNATATNVNLFGARDSAGTTYASLGIDQTAGARKIMLQTNVVGTIKRALVSTAGNIDYSIPRMLVGTTDLAADYRVYLADVPQDITTPNDSWTAPDADSITMGRSSSVNYRMVGNLYFSAMLPYTVTDAQVTAIYAYLKSLFASRGLNFQDDTPLMGASVIYDPYLDIQANHPSGDQKLINRALSGATYDATLGSSAGVDTADPQWGSNALVFPDGTDWAQGATGGILNVSNTTGVTLISVCYYATYGAVGTFPWLINKEGAYGLLIGTQTGQLRYNGNSDQPLAELVVLPARDNYLLATYDGTNFNAWVNNTQVTTNHTTVNAIATNANPLTIGNRVAADRGINNGKVYFTAMLPFSISSANAARIYTYLKSLMASRGITI